MISFVPFEYRIFLSPEIILSWLSINSQFSLPHLKWLLINSLANNCIESNATKCAAFNVNDSRRAGGRDMS